MKKNYLVLILSGAISILSADKEIPSTPYEKLQLAVRKSQLTDCKKLLNEKADSLFGSTVPEEIEKNKVRLRTLAKLRLTVQKKKLICNFSELTKYGYYFLLTAFSLGTIVGVPFMAKQILRYRQLSISAANGNNIREHNDSKHILWLGACMELNLLGGSLMLIKEIMNWRSVQQKVIEASEIRQLLSK